MKRYSLRRAHEHGYRDAVQACVLLIDAQCGTETAEWLLQTVTAAEPETAPNSSGLGQEKTSFGSVKPGGQKRIGPFADRLQLRIPRLIAMIGAILFAAGTADADTGYFRFETCLTFNHLCDGDGDVGPAGSIFACGGYVKGVMDATTVNRAASQEPPCFPGMTPEQVILITKRWLAQHPERLHLPAAFCISRAIYEAYPACQN